MASSGAAAAPPDGSHNARGVQPDGNASAGAAAAAVPDGSHNARGVQPDDGASAGAASMESKVYKKLHVLYDRLDQITAVLGRHMFYRDDVLLTLMLCKTDVGEIAQLVEERMVILPDAPQELAHDDTAPQEPAHDDTASQEASHGVPHDDTASQRPPCNRTSQCRCRCGCRRYACRVYRCCECQCPVAEECCVGISPPGYEETGSLCHLCSYGPVIGNRDWYDDASASKRRKQ